METIAKIAPQSASVSGVRSKGGHSRTRVSHYQRASSIPHVRHWRHMSCLEADGLGGGESHPASGSRAKSGPESADAGELGEGLI